MPFSSQISMKSLEYLDPEISVSDGPQLYKAPLVTPPATPPQQEVGAEQSHYADEINLATSRRKPALKHDIAR